ncbi:MAG TPA: MBL fold metallo-hydrolase [Candidatus Faecimonas gallistercoris]|nr:MBL fold metallo-hydrolase [Candidatus Faecimonas gallistercoris]
MNLKFLGIGSAFQTSLYNNCAYFIEDNQLFLIDCGETAFEQLQEQESFSDIKDIYVVFTHTHSDHIAGLGQLVDYCDNNLNKKLNIVVPSKEEDTLKEDVETLLDIFTISEDKCNFLSSDDIKGKFKTFQSMEFLKTKHSPELEGKCYSLMFETPEGKVLYTSDSIDTKYIEELINSSFSKIYADVTLSIPVVHLDFNVLKEIVPEKMRDKVYCMHFDQPSTIEEARKNGFQIADTTAKDISILPREFEYEKLEDKLILSNCGELTFMHLKNQNILDSVKEIYLPLADTNHSSVASLGSLLTYCYFVLQNPLYICTEKEEVKEHMKSLIKLYGTPESSVEFKNNLPSEIFIQEQAEIKEKIKN